MRQFHPLIGSRVCRIAGLYIGARVLDPRLSLFAERDSSRVSAVKGFVNIIRGRLRIEKLIIFRFHRLELSYTLGAIPKRRVFECSQYGSAERICEELHHQHAADTRTSNLAFRRQRPTSRVA